MDCNEALELISLDLDGLLSDADRTRLEAHLDLCPACRSLSDELLALHAAMPQEEAPPEDFLDQVMAQIRREKVVPLPKRGRSPWRAWAATAAVFALILVGGGGLRQLLAPSANSSSPAPAMMAPQAAAPAGNMESALAPAVASEDPSTTGTGWQADGPRPADTEDTVVNGAAASKTAPEPSAPPQPTYAGAATPPPVSSDQEGDSGSGGGGGSGGAVPRSGLRSAWPDPEAPEEAPAVSEPAPEETPDDPATSAPPADGNTPQLTTALFSSTSIPEPDAPPEDAPAPLTPQEALDLVADYCFGNSGYEIVREDLEGEVPSARFTLVDEDGAQAVAGGTIVYTGETEEFFLFECHWEDEPDQPYHYSVHRERRYVAWQGEAPIDGEFRP